MALLGLFPSQVFSGSTGEEHFDALRTHVPLRHRLVAGLRMRFFVPQAFQPGQGCTIDQVYVVWRRLLGFGPVNQPYVAIHRPRYSLSEGRPNTPPFLPWVCSSFRSSDAAGIALIPGSSVLFMAGMPSVRLAPARFAIALRPPLLAPIRSWA